MDNLIISEWVEVIYILFGIILATKFEAILITFKSVSSNISELLIHSLSIISFLFFIIYYFTVYTFLTNLFGYYYSFWGYLHFVLDIFMSFILFILSGYFTSYNPISKAYKILFLIVIWHLLAFIWVVVAKKSYCDEYNCLCDYQFIFDDKMHLKFILYYVIVFVCLTLIESIYKKKLSWFNNKTILHIIICLSILTISIIRTSFMATDYKRIPNASKSFNKADPCYLFKPIVEKKDNEGGGGLPSSTLPSF